jgi:hypothetical protein
MKLRYWVCRCLDDSEAYNIRSKTKKEAKARREEAGPERFSAPYKVELEYKDGFDLADSLLGEGKGLEILTNNPPEPSL